MRGVPRARRAISLRAPARSRAARIDADRVTICDQLVLGVEVEVVEDPEALAQRGGQHARAAWWRRPG